MLGHTEPAHSLAPLVSAVANASRLCCVRVCVKMQQMTEVVTRVQNNRVLPLSSGPQE